MTHPVIILDGPDCAGKTTLAETFCDLFGGTYIHCEYRFKGKMDKYHTAVLLKALKLSQTQPVIIDRFWPSELAYGNVYRTGPEVAGYELCLDFVARTYGWLYCFCVPTSRPEYAHFYAKERSHITDDEFEGNTAKACLIHEQYEQMLKDMTGLREDVLRYDMHKTNPVDAAHVAYHKAFDYQNTQHKLLLNPEQRWMSGHAEYSDIVLVGDGPNSKGRRHFWPFFESGNCSIYLMRQLLSAGRDKYYYPTRIMLANTQIDGEQNPIFETVIEDKRPEVIIPMGSVAREFLDNRKIKYEFYMSHPQYYRRFNRKAGETAFEQLYERTWA